VIALALFLALLPRDPLGVWGSWGAFRDSSPLRCFAIARPVERGRSQPFASIATWPGQGARNQLHIRLSRTRAPNARVTRRAPLRVARGRYGCLGA